MRVLQMATNVVYCRPRNDDDAKRALLSLLGKLTHNNVEIIAQRILEVQPSLGVLEGFVERLHNCAAREPKYSGMYAVLCSTLATGSGVIANNATFGSIFKRSLLQKCQSEFECTFALVLSLPESEEKEKTISKLFGIVEFIGSLYLQSMIPAIVINSCIRTLAENETGPMLEALCKLLSKVGHKLETSCTSGTAMNEAFFSRLSLLSRSTELPPRIRFQLLDLLERKESLWA
ncbi:eukaryotic translation initiation factor eIF-4F [Pelomyxa schiedti]|nr:eukaryotic translation initiation factor eIF-4F [Pelomyxa schiedti]